MGHTKATFTWQYSVERGYFSGYRRALQLSRDKRLFDQLWGKSETHLAAMEFTAHPLAIAGILVSMNLEQEKSIDQLETRLKQQAERIRKLEKANLEKEVMLVHLQKQIDALQEGMEARLSQQREELIEIRYNYD